MLKKEKEKEALNINVAVLLKNLKLENINREVV